MIAHIQQVVMIEYRLQKENERREATRAAGNSYRATSTGVRSGARTGNFATLVRRLFVAADTHCSSTPVRG